MSLSQELSAIRSVPDTSALHVAVCTLIDTAFRNRTANTYEDYPTELASLIRTYPVITTIGNLLYQRSLSETQDSRIAKMVGFGALMATAGLAQYAVEHVEKPSLHNVDVDDPKLAEAVGTTVYLISAATTHMSEIEDAIHEQYPFVDTIKFGATIAIDKGVGLQGMDRNLFIQGVFIGAAALATYADTLDRRTPAMQLGSNPYTA